MSEIRKPEIIGYWVISKIWSWTFSRDVLFIPHRLTVPYISAGSNRAGSSGTIQVPPQDLLQEGRRLHQGAGSTLQLQRAGHQPEHDNILWLRRERLHHWGKLFAKDLPARFYWSARFATESFLTVKICSCPLYICVGERWAGCCDGGAKEPLIQHCGGPKQLRFRFR